jgi:putative FmdB family regulatory protein
MPIYAYKCESCGHQKDVLQKMSDTPLVDCPECGAPALKKQLTAAGFQLKGSGWYVTDFRGGDNKSAPAGKDGAAATSTDSSPSANTSPVASPAPAVAAKPAADATSSSASKTKVD